MHRRFPHRAQLRTERTSAPRRRERRWPTPRRCLPFAMLMMVFGCGVVEEEHPVDESGLATQTETLQLPAGPQEVTVAAVEVDELERRGGVARLGRLFMAQDQAAALGPIVLSRELWESSFDGDPQVIGRGLQLSGAPAIVVGVLDGPSGAVEVWTLVGPEEPISSAEDSDEALVAELRSRYADMGTIRYFDAATDLDGDGTAEHIVHVVGPMVCGSGGCSTLVFQSADEGLNLVAEIGPGRPPIHASTRSSNGWRNLMIHVSGGGLPEGYDAELAYENGTYPSNPTVDPAQKAADLDGAELLIDEFESMDEGKSLEG